MTDLNKDTEGRQSTPLLRDIYNRAGRYGMDILRCGALWFSLGNIVFSSATGSILGVAAGTAVATGLQVAIGSYVVGRQVNATYKGQDFGAPYRVTAYANYATAATFAISGMLGGPLGIAAAAIPTVLFLAWGRAHHNIGAAINRMDELRETGASNDEIEKDEKLISVTRGYQWQGGVGDVMAAMKDKPAHEIGQLLTNPLGHYDSLIPIMFFGMGLKKTFNVQTRLDQPIANAAHWLSEKLVPHYIKNALEVPGKGVTSYRYYAMGYASGALLAIAKPAYALAQLFWSAGCYCIDLERSKPVSADDYAASITEQELPVPK